MRKFVIINRIYGYEWFLIVVDINRGCCKGGFFCRFCEFGYSFIIIVIVKEVV